MTENREKFLSRWSRLKQEEAQAQPLAETRPPSAPEAPEASVPELPPVDKLTIDSDYSGFFHPKVDEKLRRAALRKLFADPHFNVMDGLDVYIDDYSKSDPLPPEMLAQLKHGQQILAWAREDTEKSAAEAAAAIAREPSPAIPAPVVSSSVPATSPVAETAGNPSAVEPSANSGGEA